MKVQISAVNVDGETVSEVFDPKKVTCGNQLLTWVQIGLGLGAKDMTIQKYTEGQE